MSTMRNLDNGLQPVLEVLFGPTHKISRAGIERGTQSQLAYVNIFNDKKQLLSAAGNLNVAVQQKFGGQSAISEEAFNDLKNDCCYICGLPLAPYPVEIEHILPFSFALQFHAIVGKDMPKNLRLDASCNLYTPTDIFYKQKKLFNANQIIYSAAQVNLLCLEVRNSHKCCNQVKTNMLFIKQNNDKSWEPNYEYLNSYLNALYTSSTSAQYRNKGCDTGFCAIFKRAFKNNITNFVSARSEYLNRNYFSPICNIINTYTNEISNTQSPGWNLLLRFSNLSSYIDDEDFREAVTGQENKKRMSRAELFLAVGSYISSKYKQFNSNVTVKSFAQKAIALANVEPIKSEIIRKFEADIGSARNPINKFIGRGLNQQMLSRSINIFAVLFAEKGQNHYFDNNDYKNEVSTQNVENTLVNIFLTLVTGFPFNSAFMVNTGLEPTLVAIDEKSIEWAENNLSTFTVEVIEQPQVEQIIESNIENVEVDRLDLLLEAIDKREASSRQKIMTEGIDMSKEVAQELEVYEEYKFGNKFGYSLSGQRKPQSAKTIRYGIGQSNNFGLGYRPPSTIMEEDGNEQFYVEYPSQPQTFFGQQPSLTQQYQSNNERSFASQPPQSYFAPQQYGIGQTNNNNGSFASQPPQAYFAPQQYGIGQTNNNNRSFASQPPQTGFGNIKQSFFDLPVPPRKSTRSKKGGKGRTKNKKRKKKRKESTKKRRTND